MNIKYNVKYKINVCDKTKDELKTIFNKKLINVILKLEKQKS